MSLTLLLDLDGTLLENNMKSFLPGYLQAWAGFIAPFTDPDCFIKQLMLGTEVMSVNTRPDRTLRQVFEPVFLSRLDLDPIKFQPLQDQFYSEIFPRLRTLTSPIPGAIELVRQALEKGYRVGIATNALFPRTAIEQRLTWAGLPPDQYPLALIPSYESFHFAKPNPAYFSECLANLGWPEGPVVMVGDDLDLDIAGANQAGLASYWLTQSNSQRLTGKNTPTGSGSLSNLLEWIEKTPSEMLLPDREKPSALLAAMRGTPAMLHTYCSRLNPTVWSSRPHPDEWAPVEIITHLLDVEQEVHRPRLEKVLAEDNPFLPGVDSDPWATERDYLHRDGTQSLNHYLEARNASLQLLNQLSPEEWNRPARHAIFGRTHLAELVGFITGHDRLHVQQLLHST